MSTINDSDISGFSLAPYPHNNEKMLPVGLARIYTSEGIPHKLGISGP